MTFASTKDNIKVDLTQKGVSQFVNISTLLALDHKLCDEKEKANTI